MGYLEGAIRQRYTLKRSHIVYWNKSRRLGACPTMKITIYATTRRRSVLTDREVQGLNVSSGGASISDFFCSGGACKQTVIFAQEEHADRQLFKLRRSGAFNERRHVFDIRQS